MLADLSGHHDGTLNSVILDRSGNILFRQGLPGGGYAPPITINATGRQPPDGQAGRAYSTRSDGAQDPNRLGCRNRRRHPRSQPSGNRTPVRVYRRLYTYGLDGQFEHSTAFTTTLSPTCIAAADLTGNGLDDIVVADALNNSVQVAQDSRMVRLLLPSPCPLASPLRTSPLSM